MHEGGPVDTVKRGKAGVRWTDAARHQGDFEGVLCKMGCRNSSEMTSFFVNHQTKRTNDKQIWGNSFKCQPWLSTIQGQRIRTESQNALLVAIGTLRRRLDQPPPQTPESWITTAVYVYSLAT